MILSMIKIFDKRNREFGQKIKIKHVRHGYLLESDGHFS